MKIPDKISFKIFLVTTGFLVGLCAYFVFGRNNSQPASGVMTKDDLQKIESIKNYIQSISISFAKDVKTLAIEENLPSWGCGPSSYALAQIINKKFFNNQLIVDALYDNEPYEIVERFGLVQFQDGKEQTTGDHAWVEVFVKNKLIFIDPTIAQYGKGTGIAFETFDLGDPNIKDILKTKYGVIDVRISLLVRKVMNNIPINQLPYPGMTIDPNYLNYFKRVFDLRNTVSIGHEPEGWEKWVSILESKYD